MHQITALEVGGSNPSEFTYKISVNNNARIFYITILKIHDMKFWSVTTTIRNPERVPDAIHIIQEFNGFSYEKNDSNQKKYFQSLVFIKTFQN